MFVFTSGRTAAIALALAMGTGFATTASAQVKGDTAVTTPVNPGAFYWSFGASGGVQHQPKWSYGRQFRVTEDFSNQVFSVTEKDLGPLVSFDPKTAGAGPAFAVGYALDKRSALGRIGARPRIELGLTTFFGKSTQSSSVAGVADSGDFPTFTYQEIVFPAVDGSAAYYFNSQDLKLKLESSTYSGEVSLRFKTQYQVSRRFMIVPSVGPIGGLAFYRYKLEGNLVSGLLKSLSSTPDTAMQVKETIRSYHVGIEGALNFVWAASSKFMIQGGVAVAGFHRTSHLNARSQFIFTGTQGFARQIEPSDSTEVASTNDTGSTFGFRMGFNAGVTYSWGWARVSLTGFGYYDSAVPGVNNPQSNSLGGSYSSATVKHDGEWAYGGAIQVSFPLH